jgi:hypothetical protein
VSWLGGRVGEITDTKDDNLMSQDNRTPFSRRHGFRESEPPITIWEDAPEELRHCVLSTAHQKCGIKPSPFRDIVCEVLRKRPDPSNWSEYPNIWSEVEWLVHNCDWYRVYDIVEVIFAHLMTVDQNDYRGQGAKAVIFNDEMNCAFRELGVGWQLVDGMIQARGDDAFEAVVARAKEALVATNKAIAHNELEEALRDISRRPQPDATGAVQHSMAALECVAKDVTGEQKATLGQILARHGTLVPKPLDQAVDKLWGFACDKARHVREGQVLDRHEAQLVVGLAASLVNYLVQKIHTEPF